MKSCDIEFLVIFVLAPLIILISALLSACSPSTIRVSEEVIEEVAKEELEGNKQ